MIIGIVFYPFIRGFIMLENSGFFDKINKINWVAVVTYTLIGFMGYLWAIYVIKPLFFLLTGYALD